jgi:hypothetical protein
VGKEGAVLGGKRRGCMSVLDVGFVCGYASRLVYLLGVSSPCF